MVHGIDAFNETVVRVRKMLRSFSYGLLSLNWNSEEYRNVFLVFIKLRIDGNSLDKKRAIKFTMNIMMKKYANLKNIKLKYIKSEKKFIINVSFSFLG